MLDNCSHQCNPGLVEGSAQSKCRSVDCSRLLTFRINSNMGTDEPGQPYAPKLGAYRNAIVGYDATGTAYIYDDEGVYTKVINHADSIQVVNQPVMRDLTMNVTQSQVTLTKNTGELQGATSKLTTYTFPTVSPNQAGLATAALYNQIQALQQKVDTMWSGERPANPAITAKEYDDLMLSAAKYDEKEITAEEYDDNAKEALQ